MRNRNFLYKSIVLSLSLALICHAFTPAMAEDPKKVAVFPFQIHSDKDLAFLQNGIVDMLSSRLAQTGKVSVINRQAIELSLGEIDEPMEESRARSVGRELGADFVLFGSLTVFGESVSIDAKMIDVAGERETVSVFTQSELQKVLPEINQFASEINNKVFGQRSVAEKPAVPAEAGKSAPAEAPSPKEATPDIYAHPEKLIQKGFGEGSEDSVQASSVFFDLKTTSGGLYKFWKNRNFDVRISGLAIGDVDGDGNQEAVISTTNQVLIYRYEKERFYKVGIIDNLRGKNLMGVDVADINGNGISEIFISSANKTLNSVVSVVYEYDGSTFAEIVGGNSRFYRVMEIKDRGHVLLGQRQAPYNVPPPLRPIYELAWEGGEYRELNVAVQSNKGMILGAGIGDIMKSNEQVTAVYDRKDRLGVYTSGGKEIWKSGGHLGGSSLYFLMPQRDPGAKEEFRYYLPMRLIVKDLDNDGQDEVILAQNYDMVGGYMERFRNFTKSEIQIMQWDGLGLVSVFKTRKMSGAVRDLAVGDFDNDGKNELVAVILMKEGTMVGVKPKAAIISFDLK